MRPRSLILSAATVLVALTASTVPASGPYDFELQQLGEGIYVAIRPSSTRIPVEGNATILINDRDVVVVEGVRAEVDVKEFEAKLCGEDRLLQGLFKRWFVTPFTLSAFKEASGEPIIQGQEG